MSVVPGPSSRPAGPTPPWSPAGSGWRALRHPAAARPDAGRRPVRLLAVAVVLLAAGLLFGVAAGSVRRDAPTAARERAALQAQISAGTREVAGLSAALGTVRTQVDSYRRAGVAARRAAGTAAAAVRRLAPVTGAAAVRGPGVLVRLSDAAGAGGHRIADTDVSQVVNALWSAGAEAVAVNGARLTGRTAIRSAGDAILVDFRPLSPPYTVAAVGAPDGLAADFAETAVAARLRTASAVYGIGVSIRSSDRLTLPAAEGLGFSGAVTGRAAVK